MTIKTYDPSEVTITIGLPRDEHGNPVDIPGSQDLFPILVSVPAAVIRAGKAVQRAADAFKGLGISLRYPLYCVDRGDRVGTDAQYLGPFATHDEADQRREHPTDLIRRCRRLRPSEVRMPAMDLTATMTLTDVVEYVDEHATSGSLPEGAWSRIDEQIVFSTCDHGTLSPSANWPEWLDANLRIDAYICEGDEP